MKLSSHPPVDSLTRKFDISTGRLRSDAFADKHSEPLMCNLCSITTDQAAIITLFRVINRYVGL
jgi:hypothetical protein